MNSRLSEIYNKRAAELSMIPGDWYGVPINKYEGGEPVVVMSQGPQIQKVKTNMNLVPTTSELVSMREKVINTYKTKPVEVSKTFTDVLGPENSKLNTSFTKAKKTILPSENFDILGSTKYPEPPVLWQTSIGEPARLFGRNDGRRYSR